MEADLTTTRKLRLYEVINGLLQQNYIILGMESSGSKEFIKARKGAAPVKRIEVNPYL